MNSSSNGSSGPMPAADLKAMFEPELTKAREDVTLNAARLAGSMARLRWYDLLTSGKPPTDLTDAEADAIDDRAHDPAAISRDAADAVRTVAARLYA